MIDRDFKQRCGFSGSRSCGGAGKPGAKAADICSKHEISSATFYKWKAKFGGLEVSDTDTKRLKALEDENAKLKRLLAEATLVAKRAREIDPAFPIVY